MTAKPRRRTHLRRIHRNTLGLKYRIITYRGAAGLALVQTHAGTHWLCFAAFVFLASEWSHTLHSSHVHHKGMRYVSSMREAEQSSRQSWPHWYLPPPQLPLAVCSMLLICKVPGHIQCEFDLAHSISCWGDYLIFKLTLHVFFMVLVIFTLWGLK